MPQSLDQIYEAALELTEADRLELAGRLMDSVPAAAAPWEVDDPELLDELDRRAEDKSAPVPWE